jgi:hypothetical protein
MRHELALALDSSPLHDEATSLARRLVLDPTTVVDRAEALVRADDFLRTYRVRMEHLLALGLSLSNFSDLLDAVKVGVFHQVRVSLLVGRMSRVVVVRDEAGSLIGCAAFGESPQPVAPIPSRLTSSS